MNGKLKFLYQENCFLIPGLRRTQKSNVMPSYNHILIMHAPRGTLTLMQSLKKLQIMQNKRIRFWLKLDKMHYISEENFKTINWLPLDQRVQQSLNVTVFKYVNKACPYYMKEVFEYASKGRISWGRKVSYILVTQFGTNYQAQ